MQVRLSQGWGGDDDDDDDASVAHNVVLLHMYNSIELPLVIGTTMNESSKFTYMEFNFDCSLRFT